MRLSAMVRRSSVAWCLIVACGCSARATSDSAGNASPAPAEHAAEPATMSHEAAAPDSEGAAAATPAAKARAAGAKPKESVAVFSGGCFWCMETQYEGIPGVRSVVSGYTGGHKENPTYHEVGGGGTGHYEAVEIRYDPSRVEYEKLLDIFWHSIDPTQDDGQFCDIGGSYRAAIFASDSTQWTVAHESKRKIDASGILPGPIVTPIVWANRFYPAENYHQDYWKKEPVGYTRYREGCGRDRTLAKLWKGQAAKPSVH